MPLTSEEPPSEAALDAEFLALLALARDGDSAALDSLVDRFQPRVQADVHRKLARDVRASRPWLEARFSTGDVVQEVFRSVLGDLDAFGGRTEDAFCGWLAMVVRNRIIDSIRFHEADCRDGRVGQALPEDSGALGASQVTDPAAAVARAEEIERLEAAMGELEPRIKLLVRARIEGQASFRELADQLGFGSESSARRAYFEAQARLALQLKGRGGKQRGDSRGSEESGAAQ